MFSDYHTHYFFSSVGADIVVLAVSEAQKRRLSVPLVVDFACITYISIVYMQYIFFLSIHPRSQLVKPQLNSLAVLCVPSVVVAYPFIPCLFFFPPPLSTTTTTTVSVSM